MTQGSGPASPGSQEPQTPSTAPRPTGSRASARRSAGRAGSAPASAGGTGASGGGLDRYRGLLIAGAAAVVLGLVALFVLQSSGPAYACDTLLTPGPTDPPPAAAASPAAGSPAAPAPSAPGSSPAAESPMTAAASPTAIPAASPAAGPAASVSPVPEPTQRVGFATRDLGRTHAATNSSITYAFCPPTSGTHWSASGVAPVRRDFYEPGDRLTPGQWVHNLEHGYVIIAYKGEPPADQLEAARAVYDGAPPSDIATQCGMPNKVMVVRFDDMAEPWAMLSWDRALLMSEFDPEAAMAFAEQWQDPGQTPEQAC